MAEGLEANPFVYHPPHIQPGFGKVGPGDSKGVLISRLKQALPEAYSSKSPLRGHASVSVYSVNEVKIGNVNGCLPYRPQPNPTTLSAGC